MWFDGAVLYEKQFALNDLSIFENDDLHIFPICK